MLTESYNKIRAICERYNVVVETEEAYARPAGTAFQRDAFPTPDLENVTNYGLIADTNINMTGGLSNILEEPAPEPKDLSIARSLLYTADLPAPPLIEKPPSDFHDLVDPAEHEIAEAQESTRISANEQVLIQNPDLVASLQGDTIVPKDMQSLVSSNPGLFSNYVEYGNMDASQTVHLKSQCKELTTDPPGQRLGTPIRAPMSSI